MPNPVVIDFIVQGMPQVQRAIRTVEDTVVKAERAATRAAEKEAGQRQRVAQQEARDKVRAMVKVDAEVRRIQDQALRNVQRAAQAEQRVRERARAAEERDISKSAREKVRMESQATREVERIQERARARARRDAERSLRDVMRLQERNQRDQERTVDRGRRSFASTVAGAAVGGVVSGTRRVAGLAQQTAGMVTQLGGGFSIADSVQRNTALRKQAALLSASTEMAGPTARKIGTDEIVNSARTIGAKYAIDPQQVAEGFDEVKKLTGDLDKAMKVMPAVAELSTATGGNIGEMSGLAANILAANPDISDDKLKSQMRIFARQGVVGGVEIPDFAKYGSRITAGATMYGGDKEKNEAVLGAMAQMSRQYGSAGTAAEATLGSLRFSTDLAKHAGALKSKGIDVSDHKGNLRSADDVLIEMLRKTKGDVTKLAGMGLGERGVKPLEGVAALYKNAGGGAAGEKKVRDEFKKYTTGVSDEEITAALTKVLAETGTKMEKIRQEFDRAVAERIIPKLLELVPVIERLIPQFVELAATGIPAFVNLIKSVTDFATAHDGIIKSIAAHPIGTIMAYEVTKSLVSAGIGEAVKSALMKMMAGGAAGGGVPVPGGGGAGGLSGAQGGAVLGGMVAQGAFLSDRYDQLTSGGDAEKQVLGMIQRGDVQGAQAMIAEAQKNKGKGGMNNAVAYGNTLASATAYINPMMIAGHYASNAAVHGLGFETEDDKAKRQLSASAIVDSDAIKKALSAAIAEGAKQGMANAGTGTSPGAPTRTTPIVGRSGGL